MYSVTRLSRRRKGAGCWMKLRGDPNRIRHGTAGAALATGLRRFSRARRPRTIAPVPTDEGAFCPGLRKPCRVGLRSALACMSQRTCRHSWRGRGFVSTCSRKEEATQRNLDVSPNSDATEIRTRARIAPPGTTICLLRLAGPKTGGGLWASGTSLSSPYF